MKYKVYTYFGAFELHDAGTFDTAWEAEEKMHEELEKYTANSFDYEDDMAIFLANSRIEEVTI